MLEELEALLIAVATGESPNRQHATAYSEMRLAVLQSHDAGVVPGFLAQCISIHKFREFITLYDARPVERRRFIADMFDRLYSHSRAPARAAASERVEPDYVSRVF